MTDDPFALLGLDPAAGLTDDDVRVAWRRVAAATHPDRADGGDPQRFATAAAAYTELRTSFGRGEARASLGRAGRRGAVPRRGRWPAATAGLTRRASQVTGRFRARSALAARYRLAARLAVRLLLATSAAALGVLAAGQGPAGPALATGAATWLALSVARDLRGLAAGGGQPGSWPTATGRAGSADHADQDPT